MNLPKCANCTDKICVPGRGKEDAELLLCGEAPGKDEVKVKPPTCWIGKAGQELENYLNRIAGIDTAYCYLTNLCKFHPNNDRDPTKAEIEECSKVLEVEIEQVNPKYIATLGAISTRYFLGDNVTLDRCHGIPVHKDGRVILPMYHPAAGLHNSTMMTNIIYDFEALGRLVRGKARIGSLEDKYPNCEYALAKSERQLKEYLSRSNVVAIDSESVKDTRVKGNVLDKPWFGKVVPWCFSVSSQEGTGLVIMVQDEGLIRILGEKLVDANTLTLIHNSMYDLPIMQEVGITPVNFRDTMVAAYLTQLLPQGLKDLAYRLCGMRMNDYSEMVAKPKDENALRYLTRVMEVEWPKPEPRLLWSKGAPSVKGGWPLHKRVGKILSNYADDNKLDLRDRWEKIEEELRAPAEKQLGIMPIGDLSEIDINDAINYSARDADATRRVDDPIMEILDNLNIQR